MATLWLIFWFAIILGALIAFVTTAVLEKSRQKAAALALQPKTIPPNELDANAEEAMENIDSFPSENFDFNDKL